jgi:YHS domain-containing protein
MKRILHSITGVSVAAVVVLAVLSKSVLLAQSDEPNEAKGSESAKVNVDSNGVILKGCDAVGYFEQGKPIKGDSALTSTYRGATYLFASASNKAEFDKDPAKYAPQYGGYCAYGVLKGALDDFEGLGDFVIYKGKIYLNGNQSALEIFKSSIDGNIEKADANWRRLTEN